jgi:hypothetical protein
MSGPITRLAPLSGQEDSVEVVFQGEALQTLRELQRRMGVENEQAVVLQGVSLLLSAVDKEVLLRDGSRTEVIRLWRQ